MIRLFRNNQPLNLIILLLVVLILRGSILLKGEADIFWDSAPLIQSLHKVILGLQYPLFYKILSLLFVLAEAIYLNYILVKHNFFFRNSYLPALFLVLMNSLYPSMLGYSSQLLASFFMIVVLDKLFSLYDNENAVTKILDAGIFTGIAALFSFDALVFFPFVLYSVAAIRPFNIRELLLAFFGLLLPIYFLAVVYFLNGDIETVKNGFFIKEHAAQLNAIQFSYENIIPVAIALPILFISLLAYQRDIGRNNVKTRKIQQVVLLMFFFAAVTAAFAKPGFVYCLPYLSIPGGIMMSYYFLQEKRRGEFFKELVFAALGILIIVLQVIR